MKKFYFLFAVFSFSFFGAQIINFPDANFKAYLLSANATNNQIAYNTTGNTATAIDTNGNGEIEVSEAQAIKKLNLKNNTLITNISGIEKGV